VGISSGVAQCVSELLQEVCTVYVAVFPQLCRVLVSYCRLSIQTTLVSGTVWPQFAMQFLTGDCQPTIWGGDSYGVEYGSHEYPGYDFL